MTHNQKLGKKSIVSDKELLEEQRNINRNWPLFTGDTLSKETAKACVECGWAYRDKDGFFRPTAKAPGPRSNQPSARSIKLYGHLMTRPIVEE